MGRKQYESLTTKNELVFYTFGMLIFLSNLSLLSISQSIYEGEANIKASSIIEVKLDIRK